MLKYYDRKIIEKMSNSGFQAQAIADALGVTRQTIYNEFARGYTGKMNAYGRKEYSADKAQKTR